MTATSVWNEIRDFERYACQDLFHKRVIFMGQGPRPGAEFFLEHRLLGVGFWRAGRIVKWNPGRGYAFSDLSRRGKRLGFPHTYRYEVAAQGSRSSHFWLSVDGLWTARFLPSLVIKLWLNCMLWKTSLSIFNSLLQAEKRRLVDMEAVTLEPNEGRSR